MTTPARWAARIGWILALLAWWAVLGPTRDRLTVIFWIVSALVVFSSGRRPWWRAPADWAPVIAFFLFYDFARGSAHELGFPTSWKWMIDADRVLGGGVVPTVWLQERFAHQIGSAPAWEVLPALVHLSHFFVPFLLGGVLWWFSRRDFAAYALRLGLVSAIGLTVYVVAPAAPPWAAARCSAAQVSSHPWNPPCLYDDAAAVDADHSLLGPFDSKLVDGQPRVRRITTRGWRQVPGMDFTEGFLKTGIDSSNKVAAVPSLHSAGAFLTCAFLWRRVRRRWRPLLAVYPLAMGVSLVWGGDHYVIDVLLGGLAVVLAFRLASAIEQAPRIGLRMSRPGGRGDPHHWGASRKVRTPQSTVVANGHPRRRAGQCHREQTASGPPAFGQGGAGKGETVR